MDALPTREKPAAGTAFLHRGEGFGGGFAAKTRSKRKCPLPRKNLKYILVHCRREGGGGWDQQPALQWNMHATARPTSILPTCISARLPVIRVGNPEGIGGIIFSCRAGTHMPVPGFSGMPTTGISGVSSAGPAEGIGGCPPYWKRVGITESVGGCPPYWKIDGIVEGISGCPPYRRRVGIAEGIGGCPLPEKSRDRGGHRWMPPAREESGPRRTSVDALHWKRDGIVEGIGGCPPRQRSNGTAEGIDERPP